MIFNITLQKKIIYHYQLIYSLAVVGKAFGSSLLKYPVKKTLKKIDFSAPDY